MCHDKGCSGLWPFPFSSAIRQVTNYGRCATKMCILCFSFTSFLCARYFLVVNRWCWISLSLTFFPVSRIVFEVKTLTQNFSARWFYCVAHGLFTRPRHHFYDYSSFCLEIIRVAKDFSTHTVYILVFVWIHTNLYS